MTLALYSRRYKPEHESVVTELLAALTDQGVEVILYADLADALDSSPVNLSGLGCFSTHQELVDRRPDGFICLGGDGTFLHALTLVRDSGIPLIGINLGRLGFLATIETERIRDAVKAFVHNRYDIEERSVLQLEASPGLFADCPYALNDFTILKRDTSSMITVNAYINGDFVNTYWADGLIVSTPTGSTGYSLSCGGPIIYPGSGNFVITPVAPHNLGVRPLVIPDDAVLSFEVTGRTKSFLCTLDSRFERITTDHQLAIRKADFRLRLVQLHGVSILGTMREKLAWGRDLRND